MPSGGPSQATGRVQPRRAPEPGDPGVEREQAADDEQDVDRAGAVQERAPLGRGREEEAR